jgi:site-specific DNA-methyltransferase (adenine-specific)
MVLFMHNSLVEPCASPDLVLVPIDVAGEDCTMKSALFYGDNLELLRNRRFVRDESVDLCYIDPPFNSKRRYNQIYNNVGYEDRAQAGAFIDIHTWDDHAIKCWREINENDGCRYNEQTIELIRGYYRVLKEPSALLAYLVTMAARIVEIHRVLKATGCFYLHCDSAASHYLKMIVDSVFLPSGGNYLNEIIWKRVHTVKGNFGQGSKFFGPNTDTILFYSKSDKYKFEQPFGDYSKEYLKKFYKFVEPDGRRYRLISMIGPGGAAKGNPEYEFMGVTRYWRYSRKKMKELSDSDMIVQTKPGAVPQRKLYLEKGKGVAVQSLWEDIQAVSYTARERVGYPTQKPRALLTRIIETSTSEGDLILDAYCGCGTTIAVAQRLNRRWLGMDITYQAIATVLNRLEDEEPELDLRNIIQDGVPKDMKSAEALAHKRDDRLRKEFEKWAILTYCSNKAIINEKKGADKGIDGITYILTGETDTAKMVLQAKSGAVSRDDISKLQGDMGSAELAALITLEKPTQPMKDKAKAAGTYTHPLTGKVCDKIRIITVKEMIEGKSRLELPQDLAAFKTAIRKVDDAQMQLNLELVVETNELGPRKPVARVLPFSENKAKKAR